MPLQLYMVGVIVADMARAVEFYRRLGLEIPAGQEKLEHVEVKMGELTFFLSTRRANEKWDPATRDPAGGYRIILEFYLETRAALDAKYEEMIGFGYESHCAPYDVTPELRFAMVDDPDGNTILLSAATASGESAVGSRRSSPARGGSNRRALRRVADGIERRHASRRVRRTTCDRHPSPTSTSTKPMRMPTVSRSSRIATPRSAATAGFT